MWKQPPPPDLPHRRRHHHHQPPNYPNPQFHHPPPPPQSQPPPPPHHDQLPNYPNFYPKLHLPPPPPPPPDYRLTPPPPPDYRLTPPPPPDYRLTPPPPPSDYRLPPPPPFPHPFHHFIPNPRSPNCNPPINDHMNFRVSWPESDHHRRSLNSNEFPVSSRDRDEWEPSFSTSFNHRDVGVREFTPQLVGSGMDVVRDRAGRYDSAGSDFCRSSSYGGYIQRATLSMDYKDDRVLGQRDCKRQRFEIQNPGDRFHGEWDVKRQRYDDVPRAVFGVRLGEIERGSEGNRVPRVQRKSALLRIVDSSAHNGYHIKKPKPSGQSSSSKTSPFKDKYSSPVKHRIQNKGENSPRETTPVHVSFKSNSLVTKPIVSPSTPVDSTNNSSTPRNRKLSRLAALGVDDLVISSHEENQSPMKLPKSGYSPQNPSHCDKISELAAGSEWSPVNRNLSDVWTSHVKLGDNYDTIPSAETRNSSGDQKLAKLHKKKKKNLSEYRVPISMQPIGEHCGGVRSNSSTEVLNYKGSKGNCFLVSTSSTETGSLVNNVNDHSHNLLHQHIGEATMESSMKRPGCEQSDNQESQLSNDYCCKVVTEITAAKVKEIDSSKPPNDNCIQISPLEADLVCNTVIDQTCPDGIIEKGILEERIITLTVDDNIKVDQGVGFSSNSMKQRNERSAQIAFSDAIPATEAHDNDLFDKVTVDSDKNGCASPDQVGMEKELTSVMDLSIIPLDISCTDCGVTPTALNEAASHNICSDQSSLVPVPSESILVNKDGFNISNLAQGSSVPASGIEIAISTTKTGSDQDVKNNMASHERMPKGKTINISSQFGHKSTEVALGNATERVDKTLVKTNLGQAAQVDALSSISSDISSLKPSRATSGTLKYQKSYAPRAPLQTSLSVRYTIPKVQSSKMHPIKSRTWHRSDNGSTVSSVGKASGSNYVPPKHILNSGMSPSTPYIRKGNSLVRNPSPVTTVFRSPQISASPTTEPSSPGDGDKIGLNESKDDLTIGHNRFGNGCLDSLPDIQNYKPVELLAKTSSCMFDTLPVKSPDMSPTSPMTDICSKTNSSPIRSPNGSGLFQLRDEMKQKETSENQSMLTNSFVTQAALNKSFVPCQLNSASGPSRLAAENAQNNQILSSDGYYKKRMNQIIRTPLDSAQPLLVSKCNLNTEGKHAQNMVSRTSTLQSYKGTMRKPSNSSLVWTLQGAESTSKLTEGHFQCKRPTSWRGVRNPRASLNSRAMSMLRKLTLYRNQNTLYKRSTNGLSLRKYKVVAMGGCSLKWSKSIEKRSKKANEDATRAVVAAESLRREKSHRQNPMFRAATTQRTSRKHIFRIGSVRYRMDPSRKTLRRVIDDGSAHGGFEDNDSKIAYVPKRLAIGKNEYIRIGNGNQLIRDPKKRIRLLANEKIRWSLHNVRQRLMKKSRFCQFYTRFGKCNKDDGKCPYIHDSSKIAVCTKFLRGICSDPNCKLTHKVIPERMEDCSYFLQGMCSNESCPYRHVNVNPKATTCEGFLRGYCADGDECRKKHSYVCHIYEETGTCPEGSKCKLHHPKKQRAKHTVSRLQNFLKGRYFGKPALEVSDLPVAPLNLSSIKSSNTFEGELPEFIRLDDGDDEINVTEDVSCSSKHNDNDMDVEPFDLNTFIKPTRIMNSCYGDIKMDNRVIRGS